MRMLFLTEKLPPSEGGSRVYYYNLCTNYDNRLVVVLTKKVDGYREFDSKIKFKILRYGSPLKNWKFYRLPTLLPQLLRTLYLIWRENIDIIHCGEFFPSAFVGIILKKLLRMPYVYYVHGEAITWFKQYPRQYRVFRYVLENADAVVAACTYAEEGLLDDYAVPRHKLYKILPGVDYDKFRPGWRDTELVEQLGLSGKRVLLTIGRLIERKGQDTVIRALPDVLAVVPNAVYLVGGRGPHEDQLRKLAFELGVAAHVIFLGFIPDEQLVSLYSICDVFVMVNRDTKIEGPEGFGMVFTEASASGKPVIGGRSGGTQDSIVDGKTGYRVDPYNVKEVTVKIVELLLNEHLAKEMGDNGREWVESTFNWRSRSEKLVYINKHICEMS